MAASAGAMCLEVGLDDLERFACSYFCCCAGETRTRRRDEGMREVGNVSGMVRVKMHVWGELCR